MTQHTIDSEETLSRTITFLRFPLIAVVIFSHVGLGKVVVNGISQVGAGQFPVYEMLYHLVSHELTRVAVALFFFISGFLFFWHTDFSPRIYVRKMHSRAHTLLLPYLFWNMVVFGLLLLSQQFFASAISGQEKAVAEYGWQDWLCLFWSHHDGMPICYQFWFIRDLIVTVAFTPFIYGLIRYGREFGLMVLGALWLLNIWIAIPGFDATSFFFFSLGAFFSIRRRNPVTDLYPLRWTTTVAYVALVGFNTWLWHCGDGTNPYIHRLSIVVGLTAVLTWTARGISLNTLPVSTFLAASSFFVYAYHGKPAAVAVKCWVKAFSPMQEWSMLAGYMLIPIILMGIGIALYAMLRHWFPRFTALITGGR